MDWFTLIAEISARDRSDSFGEESDLLRSTSLDDEVEDIGAEVGARLEKIEAAGLACVLNHALTQLSILGISSNCSLSKSRNLLFEVIQDTEYELRRSGSYQPLYEKAKEEVVKKKEAGVFEQRKKKNELMIKRLHLQLRGNERRKMRELHKKQEIIAALKDQIQDIVSNNDVQLRYIDRWETSRQEQSLMRCDNAELQLKHRLEEVNDNCSTELRVYEEICAYLNLAHKKLERECNSWKEKYEVEMEKRNSRMRVIRAKRTEEQVKLRQLTELYEEHQREINEYLEHKEQKRREAEHDKFIYDMVTKIQAWWRGTMVRRGLGPYKRRKKLVKDKKKK